MRIKAVELNVILPLINIFKLQKMKEEANS
jgi:hypothetical protein